MVSSRAVLIISTNNGMNICSSICSAWSDSKKNIFSKPDLFFSSSFLFLIKSHLSSYPCPNNINYFRDIGFLLGISIVLQLITGILALHYTTHIRYSYYSIMYIIREIYYGRSLRYSHSNGASFLFTVLFMNIGRGLYYGYYY